MWAARLSSLTRDVKQTLSRVQADRGLDKPHIPRENTVLLGCVNDIGSLQTQ